MRTKHFIVLDIVKVEKKIQIQSKHPNVKALPTSVWLDENVDAVARVLQSVACGHRCWQALRLRPAPSRRHGASNTTHGPLTAHDALPKASMTRPRRSCTLTGRGRALLQPARPQCFQCSVLADSSNAYLCGMPKTQAAVPKH